MWKSIFSFLKRHLLLCGRRISNDAKSLEDAEDQEASLLEEQERGRLVNVAAPALYPQNHHCIDIHVDGAADFDKPGESPPAFTLDNNNGEQPQFSSVELMLEKEDGRAEDNEVVINCTQYEVLAPVAFEGNYPNGDIVGDESLKPGTDDTRQDLADPASIPAMNSEDCGQLNNTSLGTEEINEVFEVRSLGPYNNTQKILLVGEGDFSFSASLAIAFGSSASNMIATSLDSCEFLMENYERVEGHLYELALRGCGVLHNFDATKMARSFLKSRSFDRIVFNFPHAGFPRPRKSREAQIRRNQELVKGFLANAKEMIKKDGEIHITHKCNGFHSEWCIVKLARSQGLRLLQQVPFRIEDYPGYETKYGFGGDKNFDCNPSKTYKFVLRERLKELQSKGIKQ